MRRAKALCYIDSKTNGKSLFNNAKDLPGIVVINNQYFKPQLADNCREVEITEKFQQTGLYIRVIIFKC